MEKLRMGMVGGGDGAFIGPVHRLAAELDGAIELVCGCFSRDAQRSLEAGQRLYGLRAQRCYPTFQDLLRSERARPASERMDFVAITTPNDSHYAIARAVLEAGFPVVCDKPVTITSAEAEELERLAADSGLPFAVTYNYSGYPMVKQARALVAAGALGTVRRVNVEYLQGWLSRPQPADNRQATWRTDPERAGIAGCVADIGSHAHHLAEYVTGLQVESVCADLGRMVAGRRLDDDASVLLRFGGGARGVMSASQIAVGEENALSLRVYGELGGIAWRQMEPNSLTLLHEDRPAETLRTAGGGLVPAATAGARLPAGHPEGFLEAFANLYRAFAARLAGADSDLDFPTIADGARGMRFIEAAVRSSGDGRWAVLESFR